MHKLGIQKQLKRDHSGDTSRTLSSVNTVKTSHASRLSSNENLKENKPFEKSAIEQGNLRNDFVVFPNK